MSKIGILFCAYQCEDLLSKSLTPWINLKQNKNRNNHSFDICVVSVPFEGFDHGETPKDNTRGILGQAAHNGEIDHVIVTDKPMKEVDARGLALKYLKEYSGSQIIWMVDSDEVYTEKDINNILNFVESNPFVTWFKVSLKNLVFDNNHYLEEPFTPPRIYRIFTSGGYIAEGFYDDNNIYYKRPFESSLPDNISDKEFSSLTIPKTVAFVPHVSWLSNERSKRKIAYQISRGWKCSFEWDDQTNSLIFNEDYYRARGLAIPRVVSL